MDNNKKQRILAWDVGIKNLAYCLIEKYEDNFEIIKWDIINLSDDTQKCQFQMRGDKECCQSAKFCIYHKDKEESLFSQFENGCAFVCKRHKDTMTPVLVEIEIKDDKKTKKTKKTLLKEEKENNKKCTICKCDSNYYLSNTEYCWCVQHYEKKGKSFINKIHTKKVTQQSCMKQPLQALSEKLFKKLDEIKDFMTVDEVLIENQPAILNRTMKTISTLLFSYFILRGITDIKTTNSTITNVRFVAPSGKLTVNKNNTSKVLDVKKEEVYKMTKKLSVKYCIALVSDKDAEFIKSYKKQDDLADAFLHGFKYLFTPVPKKYFDKIEKIGFEDPKTKKTDKTKKVLGQSENGEITLESKKI